MNLSRLFLSVKFNDWAFAENLGGNFIILKLMTPEKRLSNVVRCVIRLIHIHYVRETAMSSPGPTMRFTVVCDEYPDICLLFSLNL